MGVSSIGDEVVILVNAIIDDTVAYLVSTVAIVPVKELVVNTVAFWLAFWLVCWFPHQLVIQEELQLLLWLFL